MLDALKKAVFHEYNPEEKRGVFLSGYAEDKSLVFSQGVATSDTSLVKNIEALYKAYAEPHAKKTRFIACDIVGDITEYTDTPNDFLALSPEEYGFIAIDKEDDISGVLLPNTSGVVDAKSALYDLKQKYGIHGQVALFAFRTTRILLAK